MSRAIATVVRWYIPVGWLVFVGYGLVWLLRNAP